jgi:hypothetical protein
MPWFGEYWGQFDLTGFGNFGGVSVQDTVAVPIGDRPVGWVSLDTPDPSPGRRLRVFALLVQAAHRNGPQIEVRGGEPFLRPRRRMTYAETLRAVQRSRHLAQVREQFGRLPLRVSPSGREAPLYTRVPDNYEFQRGGRDPDLHPALQDLACEIVDDIVEACAALDDPDIFYPGIDEGIEPVSDEHVQLVVWAMQRELERELRGKPGDISGRPLPAVPLAQLPWRVQRALAERRRWRFRQYGIGREQWLKNCWSLWDVPEERDWVPRRSQKLYLG